MNKEFIPYEQALALKELGFDEPCFAQYRKYDIGEATLDIGFSKNEIIMQFHKLSKFCSSPTYQQAFRWFREKYKIEATISCFYNKRLDIPYEERQYHCYIIRDGVTSKGPKYKTYEEAELACLDKLIEICKN